ncbi:hypothetical protein ACFU7Y_03910 [Kitasatospora sp. NPDC057542]|uniref:hypothetical protein n=1 Tax=Streptomycetaceae TaxID=2062 RepID=UPI001CC994FF|nr:hypothetical protein [Streptomyces sp. LS1784]
MIYTSVPPEAAPGARRNPGLRLARLYLDDSGPTRPYNDTERAFISDLLQAHGLPADIDRVVGQFTPLRDMLARILPRLTTHDRPFDLALLACATPDAELGWSMSRLARVLPGSGLGFAISDQGPTAPFAALRLAVDGVVVDDPSCSLVILADQAVTGLSAGRLPEEYLPHREAIAALVLDVEGGIASLDATQLPGVLPEAVPTLTAAWLKEAEADTGSRPVLLAGPGLTGTLRDPSVDVEPVPVPPGLPCVGLWSRFAEELPRLRRTGGTVLLAEYDTLLGYLGLCRVDVDQAPGGDIGAAVNTDGAGPDQRDAPHPGRRGGGA